MDASAVQVKPEPSFLHRNSSTSLCSFRDRSNVSPSYCADSNEATLRVVSNCVVTNDSHKPELSVGYSGHEVCPLPSAGEVDFFSSKSTNSTNRDAPLDSLINIPCVSISSLSSSSVEHGSNTGNFSNAFTCGIDAHYEAPDSTEMSSIRVPQSSLNKPSEALFVRALIGRCKRIAPLWFRGVSSMRERNREENRRMANTSGQTQNDWSLIGLKIAEMDTAAETDAVANLLKKLYKELPADSVFWFLKCWLCSEDSVNDPDSCVISRGDAKGRMRRIDGGKGSDKVWRLDTIVGMLYHGLPMSSTDTNIMVHTCDQELCVRPQHIRFRASSVALVVVLKALAQAGYTVLPPKVPAGLNGVAPNASDESVDVFGPFTIDELQRYRSENLIPSDDCSGKLSLSDTDREFAESVPVLRTALMSACETKSCAVVSRSLLPHLHHINGYHPCSTAFKPEDLKAVSSELLPSGAVVVDLHSPQSTTDHMMLSRPQAPTYLGMKQVTYVDSPSDVKPPSSSLISGTKPSVSAVGIRPHHSDRRSLKRPAPIDSSCSFHSSSPQPSSPPDSLNSLPLLHSTCHRRQRLSSSTLPTPLVAPAALSGFLPGDPPASSNAPFLSCPGSSSCVSTSAVLSSTSVCSQISDSFTTSTDPHSLDLCNAQQPFPAHSLLRGFQTSMCIPGTLSIYPNSSTIMHQPYPLHQPSAPPNAPPGLSSGPYLSHLGAHGPNGQVAFTLSSGSNSGKTTPRQPAKKRLEARTPTIDGAGEDPGSLAVGSHGDTPNLDDSTSMISTVSSGPGSMAFRVHQNTPFVPVQSRSGRPSSSGSSSSASGFQFIPTASTAGVSPSVGGLLRKTSHFGISDSEAALPVASRVPITNTAQSDDEEEEELIGIMVGRSTDSALHTSSDAAVAAGDRKRCTALPSGSQPLGPMSTFQIAKNSTSLISSTSFPEVGRSPMCERHVIEMIGALLANSAASPSFRRSSHGNSRRSASASSLPYVGTSPNENLPHLTNSVGLPHPSASIYNMRSSPSHVRSPVQSVPGKFPLSVHPETNVVSSECGPPSLFGSGAKSHTGHQHSLHSSTPPPRLTPMSDLDGIRPTEDPHSISRLPALQPLQLNGESNPGQEIVNLIRNSPASGITPELIDMLYNMAQQYGVHQPRAGSCASRSSSQVAQNFYRSLINGSVCSSPFPANTSSLGSFSNTLNVSNTACQTDNVSTSAAPSGSSMLSPTSCSILSSTPPLHHLRGLSFTPLSVDPEQTNCSSTASGDWAEGVSASQTAPACAIQPPHYSSRTVTHPCGLNQPRGPLPTTGPDESSCRRFVKH